jgi:hypothetical protein
VPPATSTTTTPPDVSGFAADFSTSSDVDRFVWQLHTSTTGSTVQSTDTHQGDHDMSCGQPDTTKRTVQGGDRRGDPIGDERYWCPSGTGHLMTSVDTGAVAVLSFSPPETFTNVQRVCFDVDRAEHGEGTWANLIVVPAAAHGSNPDLSYWGGGLGGNKLDPSQREVPVGGYVISFLRGTVLGFAGVDGEGNAELGDLWGANESNIDPSAAGRYPVCLVRVNDTTARVEVFHFDTKTVESRTYPMALPAESVVVFQHGSYNPTKHGTPATLTWHWDNISIVEG